MEDNKGGFQSVVNGGRRKTLFTRVSKLKIKWLRLLRVYDYKTILNSVCCYMCVLSNIKFLEPIKKVLFYKGNSHKSRIEQNLVT